jgi:hypothetical protein
MRAARKKKYPGTSTNAHPTKIAKASSSHIFILNFKRAQMAALQNEHLNIA